MQFAKTPAALAIACILPHAAGAQEATSNRTLDEIVVSGARMEPTPMPAGRVDGDVLSQLRAGTSDTASLLADVPGVNLQGAGATSACR